MTSIMNLSGNGSVTVAVLGIVELGEKSFNA